jgi:hypothetical protein
MDCPICLTRAKGEFKIKTPCNHALCLRCFLKLQNTLCPMCRRDFKNELPGDLKRHFETKEALEKINIPIVSNSVDIDDEYEFPPLS